MPRLTPLLRAAARAPDPQAVRLPYVQPWHRRAATVMGATMWLWIFYRFKQDGKAFLGLEYPWEAHHGGDAHHGGEEEEH